VIGYRALETFETEHEDLSFCVAHGSELLKAIQPTENQGTYRWYISVNLLLGYIAVLWGRLESAGAHFNNIVELASHIEIMPQMLTNILKATYFLGRIQKASGDVGHALTAWGSALPLYRKAAPLWRFENYYSYGELAQSLQLTQECYASRLGLNISLGQAVVDTAVAPKELKTNYECLGFPGADLCRKGLL
jgi:hypothetical protein